jgi:hypothetical protein
MLIVGRFRRSSEVRLGQALIRMMDLALPLTTERLTLRLFRPDDVEDVFAYQGREEVAPYLYRPARTRERCAEAVARVSAGTRRLFARLDVENTPSGSASAWACAARRT